MLEKIIATTALATSVSLTGCTTYLPMNQQTSRKAQQLPQTIKTETIDTVVRELKEKNCDYDEYTTKLLSQGKIQTTFQSIEAKQNTGKWIIMYPILGGEDLLIVGHIARNVFAERGINSAILLRKELLIPYETKYRPLKSDNPAITDFEDYQHKVLKDTLRILKYLQAQGMKKLGLMGISLGAMQTAGIAPFVPESRINIIIMGGGDIAEIMINSTEGIVQEYKQNLLKEYGSEEKLRQEISTIKIEPLKLAKYVSTEKTRMVITTKDTVVPTKNQWQLYKALGGPTTLLVPTGHYSLILCYFQVRNFVVSEIEKEFD